MVGKSSTENRFNYTILIGFMFLFCFFTPKNKKTFEIRVWLRIVVDFAVRIMVFFITVMEIINKSKRRE